MEINKDKTVSFTSYRTHKVLRSTNEPDIIKRLHEELEQTINAIINQGYMTFLSGMEERFDMLATEAVLRIRMKRPEIKMIAVVPFQGQELEYTPINKERYKIICELGNKIVFTLHVRLAVDLDPMATFHPFRDRRDALLCLFVAGKPLGRMDNSWVGCASGTAGFGGLDPGCGATNLSLKTYIRL